MFSNLVFLTKGEVSHPHTKYPLDTKTIPCVHYWVGRGRRFFMTQGLVRHHLLELLDSFGMIGMMFSQAWFPSVMHDFCKNPI